ncbi:hypothetical protein JCM17844_28370 [Iodidimonas gelatinilytica]|uniref:Type-F conjugative transfer system pilin assembly protein TrbC n=1 Tax=Iodidimonas gelatinilytica TaxID=1236966 RepID=A0A5A7MTG6_9PROT|nr:type-F conjugative transfer system pilin assembly protein TrbC [Iodidimonas gelatinilytica]GEQ99200.1 hypothetical protein JCM17844_28370 [Iodidimonas gelatinilytica]
MAKTQLLCRMTLLFSLMLAAPAVQAEEDTDAWMQRMLEKTTKQAAPSLETKAKPSLLSFVSFSMPDDSLKAILEQTARAGGVTVLRGLVENSFKETALRVGTLAREHGPGFSVDPRLFTEHSVTTVPAFVVVGAESVDKISGNMSLAAALETIAREGDNKSIAQGLLGRLRGAP